MAYVDKALFVYSEEGGHYLQEISSNPHGTEVTSVPAGEFLVNPEELLRKTPHLVVSVPLKEMKEVMRCVMKYGGSIGFLPLEGQRALRRCYMIPEKNEEMIELALRDNPVPLDIVLCNEKILLFKATIGRLPLFDSHKTENRLKIFLDGLRRMRSLHLLPFTIETGGKNRTSTATAASGCLVLENPEASFASKMIDHDCSFQDGMISTVIIAPFSIVDYLKLLWMRVIPGADLSKIPPSVGYIKSPEIIIDSERQLSVVIDGEKNETTPAAFRVIKAGVKINQGQDSERLAEGMAAVTEKFVIKSLPLGKEISKTQNKRVPFFTYASEERFKDLFTALRDDARLDSTYLILMVLSTVLATVGLYLNSSSVIIGAMLLAPLMAPIIALAMGLLRYDRKLFRQSLLKIAVGMLLALTTSLVFTFIIPYQPFTDEMQGRLNPTVLDLMVAIAAGVAGAYTKSFKEILQSLAGVAIAVALVPPLAVAGIGLGRLDPSFFGHAFLLFLTNLIGIILAATFTFRMLGYSPVVRDKKSILLVVVFFVLISIPLSFAFKSIVERASFEKSWEYDRFLVNDKYLIVKKATVHTFEESKVLTVEIQAREPLTRSDLNEFRRKVKYNFYDDIIIRARITYIP